jgi:hypothetical protein
MVGDSFPWGKELGDREILERFVLALLYVATEGDLWTLSFEWLSGLSVCDWYGVTCTPDGLVSDLALSK